MNSLIDDLWAQVEENGELSAPLVDAVMEEDEVFGSILLWCYQNGKWPGSMLGRKQISKEYWFIRTSPYSVVENSCYLIPWMKLWKKRQDSARKAYEALIVEWENARTEVLRQTMTYCAYAMIKIKT